VKLLVDRLPPESATKTAARDSLTADELAELAASKPDGAGHGAWSHQDLLMAAQFDVLQQIRHVLIVSSGGKSEMPKPWPRPGAEGARKRLTASGHSYLDRLAAQHEQARRKAGLS
jgi:hypothetical protein